MSASEGRATIVVTADRERLDRIAKQALGTERGGALEALLDLNPGLADSAFARLGRRVRLPAEIPAPAAPAAPTRPWE